MKQFRYKEWLFVEVSEDAITFNIEEKFDYLDYKQIMNGVGLYRRNAINKSSIPVKDIRQYSIIGKADELTERQKIEIMEVDEVMNTGVVLYKVHGKLYDEPEHSRILATYDVSKALNSLIKLHDMALSTTLVLKLNEAHAGDKV